MNHPTGSRLAHLMKLFGATGRELAKALHVDYSLISKWKNNKRTLQPRSAHVSMLAKYFLTLDRHSGNRKITLLLQKAYPDIEITASNLPSLLCQWLSEPDIPIGGSISSAPSATGVGVTNNMYSAGFEVYLGKKGRRAVVDKFLDLAVSLPGGQDLLLISQEDMSWFTEDRPFFLSCKGKLEIILKKHNVTIIHTVDRRCDELAAVLQHWLPLHMSGRIESWYFPFYSGSPIKTTLFILRNIAAVYGVTVEETTGELYSAFYQDAATLSAYEGVYSALLSKCAPLLEKYPTNALQPMFEKLLATAANTGNSFYFSNIPTASAIPEKLLREILTANHVDADKIQYTIDILSRASSQLTAANARCCTRHIYSCEALRQMAEMERIPYPDLSLLTGREIVLTPGQYREHIRSLVEILMRSSCFELGLITTPNMELAGNVNIWVKETHIAVATTYSPNNCPVCAASASEPTIVNAFYHFYGMVWNSIPRIYRSKEWVAGVLAKIAE